jgi:hypothetical protein
MSAPFRERLKQLSGDERDAFIDEQRKWINERNERCELKGKDKEPIEKLASAKPCMASAIKGRTATLTGGGDALLPDHPAKKRKIRKPIEPDAAASIVATELVFSPWRKQCQGQVCAVGSSGHNQSGKPEIVIAMGRQAGAQSLMRVILLKGPHTAIKATIDGIASATMRVSE